MIPSPAPGDRGRRIESPIGPLVAAGSAAGVCLLEFADDETRLAGQLARVERRIGPPGSGGSAMLDRLERELSEYFAGARHRFEVPLLLAGTPFQERVWRALLEIPYGATASYSDVAARIGRPGAQRAVGLANGRNPLAIVVPCHRVIERAGGLRGYGGGLWRKQFLLDLERRAAGRAGAPAPPAQLALFETPPE